MKRLIIPLIILIVIVTGIILLSGSNTTTKVAFTSNSRITIVTSVYPIYDFAREITGNNANVVMLLSPGVELHDFEPTPQDIINIEESDLFLYTGEDLEPWAKKAISGIDDTSNIKDVTTGTRLIKGDEDDDEKYDAHIWLDLEISIQIIKNMTDMICNLDPENTSTYQYNRDQYISKLTNLDNQFFELTQNAQDKEIAFGGPFAYSYFIRRYNLNYISAYDTCGENSEPSTKKVLEVIKEIQDKKIPVVFYKELSSGNIVDTIVQETECKKLEFHSLHSISKEELDNNETYLSIMTKNLENLREALK